MTSKQHTVSFQDPFLFSPTENDCDDDDEKIIRQPLLGGKHKNNTSSSTSSSYKKPILPRVPILEARTRILKSIIKKQTGKCCEVHSGDVLSYSFRFANSFRIFL